MNEKIKAALYRKCAITNLSNDEPVADKSLEDLLQQSCNSVQQPWFYEGRTVLTTVLLTRVLKKNSCLCGEVVFYERGRHIPLVDINSDGTPWQDVIEPKDKTGVSRNLQEHTLFFAIRENHIAIIQSGGAQVHDLEQFLTWFTNRGAVNGINLHLSLQNLPSKAALEKLKDSKIKGIKFREQVSSKRPEAATTPHFERPPNDALNTVVERHQHYQEISTSPFAVTMLKQILGPSPILDDFCKSRGKGAIKVGVTVTYTSRSENEGAAVLHALADTLGKVEELDTEIMLEGRTSIKGKDLRVAGSIKIQCPDGVVAPDDAMSKLSAWLAETIMSGRVP